MSEPLKAPKTVATAAAGGVKAVTRLPRCSLSSLLWGEARL